MNKKQVIIGASVVVVITLAIGYYWYDSGAEQRALIQDPFANVKVPDGLDAATKQIYEEKIAATKEMYQKMPNIWETWVAIGNLMSLVGDKEGALAAYQQSVALQPNNIVAERNIAVLYADHFHDYERAAAHYRAAIRNEVNSPDLYISLINIQWKKLNDVDAAKKTLEEGFKRTGNNYDLVNFAVSFYAEIGDTAAAENYGKILDSLKRPTTPEPTMFGIPNTTVK